MMLPRLVTYGDDVLRIEDRQWLVRVSLFFALAVAVGLLFWVGSRPERVERPVPEGPSVDFSDVSSILSNHGAYQLVADPFIGNWWLENSDGEKIGLLIKVESR